jgi:peptide/nickel transport system permease protein
VATTNRNFRYTTVTGENLSDAVAGRFVMAATMGETAFENGDDSYTITQLDEDFYIIGKDVQVASALNLAGKYTITPSESFELPDDFEEMLDAAIRAGETQFQTGDGNQYTFKEVRREYIINSFEGYAVATKLVFDTVEKGQKLDYDFVLQAELAYRNPEADGFDVAGQTYTITRDEDGSEVYDAGGKMVALISNVAVQAVEQTVELSFEFRQTVKEAIANQTNVFYLANEEGVEEEYTVIRRDQEYMIRRDARTYMRRIYEAPSKEHWLGLDGNSMDIVTRLMYGGRISLTIGFVVVLIEVFIGVVIGGIAGYFGKWVDNICMRIVDVFNCIPTMPIYIILGSVMDEMKVDPQLRIYVLMLVLGILGWPSIARMVRGQILSLREQEFMTATEATGISVRRRISRHLIPNVIPQLIVVSTMTLGGVILTEAVLSFLGLGVKYPMASWGNIINAVSDPYVMTNYWYVWIPAGCLILLTVLGFNFIGDGLRDAFDPKMKR